MRTLVWTLATVLAAPAVAQIAPTPGSQPIKPAFDAADLVCYCFVRAVAPETTTPTNQEGGARRRMRAEIEVRDVYKSVLNEQSTTAEFMQSFPGSRGGDGPTLWTGESAILFLKAVRPGKYEFAERFLGAIPFRSFTVLGEGAGLEKLQAALVAVLHGNDEEDKLSALRLLHGFDLLSRDALSQIAPLANSKDPEIAFWVLALLLKSKTPDSVTSLAAYLDSYHGDAQEWAMVNLDTDLAQIRDMKARPALEVLTASKFVPIRDGAMRALRTIRDPHSAPALVRRLDDPEYDIQYLAVITLAEAFGKYEDFAPNMALFEKSPRKYTDLWKKWWADEGSKLYPPASTPK